jgi:hypothetical protein
MAKAGKVPGAAKIEGEWTFNLERLRGWVKELEEQSCQTPKTTPAESVAPPAAARSRPIRSGTATSSTAARQSRASYGDGRYEQAMSKLLAYGSRKTSRR